MRKSVMAAMVAMISVSVANANLIISEVVDGTLSGGNPKFVEITNTGATDFTFAEGGIIVQSNANTDLDIDVDLTGITITAGDSYVIQSSANGGQSVFETTYGFAADLYTSAFFSNGDDRYILTDTADSSNLVDIHGQIDTDGTGEVWEYTDGYAFRNADVLSGNSGLYVHSEWTTGGVNSLETGDDVEEAALIVQLTTPGTHNFVPEPASAFMIAIAGGLLLRRRR